MEKYKFGISLFILKTYKTIGIFLITRIQSRPRLFIYIKKIAKAN